MANVKEIRNRVKSVKNTQKITRAMKLVAAAKLRRAQDAVVASRPYAVKMREVVGELCRNADEEMSPFFRNPETPKKALIIVLTSDRGLCGGYNSALLRKLKTYVNEESGAYDELGTAVIGRKGREFVRRENITVSVDLSEYPALANVEVASAISNTAMESFRIGEIDRVYILFNRFQSALSQIPSFERLLPLDPDAFAEEDSAARDYKYEPGERGAVGHADSAIRHLTGLRCVARVRCVGAGRTNDSDGQRDEQRVGFDRHAYAADEPRTSGDYYHRADGDHRRL